MRILCIGDIVGNCGISFVEGFLPTYREENNIDFVVANGENASVGNGLLPADCQRLLEAGVDVLTGGNHSLDRREIYPVLEEKSRLLRPANFDEDVWGAGALVLETPFGPILVVSLLGQVFMPPQNCPFKALDRVLEAHGQVKIRLVDFHAEATSEKRVMGYYADGRCTAVFGTHTHVQTADEGVSLLGTGFISDIGMCGVMDSVIGGDRQVVMERMTKHIPTRMREAKGAVELRGILLEVDEHTGKCIKMTRIQARESSCDDAARL